MSELQLFPDDGVTRPPGVPETARPDDGTVHQCPKCGERKLYWLKVTRAMCGLRPGLGCGYVWRRSGQLHHSERLPI